MLQSRQCNARSRFLTFCVSALSIFIAGCGGGGGGGSDGPTSPSKAQTPPPEPTPLEKTPLAFTMGTAQYAASQSVREVELPLIYTHFAIQVLKRSGIPAATSTKNCLQGGTETIDFSDLDNSGTPTKGDTLSVRYEDCRNDASLLLNGQYSLAVNNGTGITTFGGVARFAQFNALVTSTATDGTQTKTSASLEFNGSVEFYSQVDGTNDILDAKTDDKGLKIEFQDPTNPREETVVIKSARKELDHAKATYRLTLEAVLQSQLLSGQVEVLTPSPIIGSLNAFPSGNTFRVKGAVAIVDLLGIQGTSKVDVRYSDGDNQMVPLDSSQDWGQFCSLFYFWDSDHGSSKDVVTTPPDVLYNSIPVSGVLSTNPTILLQLARPLAATSVPAFMFQPPQSSSAPSVNAIPEINGARLTLKPGVTLQPTTIYNIVPDKSSYPAETGAALVIPSFGFSTE